MTYATNKGTQVIGKAHNPERYPVTGWTESNTSIQHRAWRINLKAAGYPEWSITEEQADELHYMIELMEIADTPIPADESDLIRWGEWDKPRVLTGPNLLQKLADEQNRQFNLRYYGNEHGKSFSYGRVRSPGQRSPRGETT